MTEISMRFLFLSPPFMFDKFNKMCYNLDGGNKGLSSKNPSPSNQNLNKEEKGMWYHGSKKLVSVLKRQQAWGPPGTPKSESLNMIYFTPDFAFALACAVSPEGVTEVNHNERTVHFENPEKFDPEKEVYIYMVDPSKIPDDKKTWIDKWQVAVDLDEIKPDKVERHKAGEVSQYYSIIP